MAISLVVEWIHGSPNCLNNTNSPIQVHRLNSNTFILRQNKCVEPGTSFEGPFMYLLFGDDRAMLLDTGATNSARIFPIGAIVRGIMANWLAERDRQSISMLICHSHAHDDHAQGDDQFRQQAGVTIVPPTLEGMKQFFGFSSWPEQIVTVDLGNRTLDVIPVPGHEAAHIAFYDRATKLLLSGDTLYPGLLVVRDWSAYRQSIARLKRFADDQDISYILGAHIEMKSTPGKWFGYPALYQPGEHVLQLEHRHLIELNEAMIRLTAPQIERHDDFIIQPVGMPSPEPD